MMSYWLSQLIQYGVACCHSHSLLTCHRDSVEETSDHACLGNIIHLYIVLYWFCTISEFCFCFTEKIINTDKTIRRQEVYSQYLRVTWPMANRPTWPNSFARVISFQKPHFFPSNFSLWNCQYHERENNRGESNV